MRSGASPDDRRVESEHPVSVDSSTELRWFFSGLLPAEVLAWFTHDGSAGWVQVRCDRYLDDGLGDVGVKRRFRTILELKKRLSAPEPVSLGGVMGELERWQRWSPADALVDIAEGATWIDVEKRVIKRRFDAAGDEAEVGAEASTTNGHGCDVELVALTVGREPAWSFAFSAFGDMETQRGSAFAAWSRLMTATAGGAPINFSGAVPLGYPEWLVGISALTTSESPIAAAPLSGSVSA